MNSYESSSFSPRKRPRLSPQTSLSYFNSSSTHPSSTSKDDPKGNTEATSPPQADEQTSGFYLFKSLSLSGMNFDSTSINSQHRRLIIGLDIDNFYVAAARKLDPSLIGKPVGIKQKVSFPFHSYASLVDLVRLPSNRSHFYSLLTESWIDSRRNPFCLE